MASINSKVSSKIKGSTILITGGTGSFGNTVTEKLLEYNPSKIIIYSRDEKKQFDMRNKFENPKLRFIIGDVRDIESTMKAMEEVDYVFHAAALKQVPTCEFFPMEAVKTNIIGTYNIIQAARYHNVKRVVVLSTDKAAYPINVIGLSKAMMEKVMIAEAKIHQESDKKHTILCSVRYGNVLYTRGSVIPYFISLMKQGKKISVTNFQMTRFLLPLPHAVDLVFYALLKGKSGYIYVRKSPSCTLETIAVSLCRIFKYSPGHYEVGIRAGEKMHETLVTQEEILRAKEEKNYYIIPPESQSLDYNQYFFRGRKLKVNLTSYTSDNTKILDIDATISLLLKLPEIQIELRNWKLDKTNGRNHAIKALKAYLK